MKEAIKNRLQALRQEMQKENIAAYIISGTNPHLSEYVPERWLTREYISGFTGSAGMVIITLNDAALWTDSRYFLQAESQLSDTEIRLMKMQTPGTPEPTDWLKQTLSQGEIVGTDGLCISIDMFDDFSSKLIEAEIKLKNVGDLLDKIWHDRPAFPLAEVFEHQPQYQGKSCSEKIDAIRKELIKSDCDIQPITALDDLAWSLNLRGTDIEFNPLFLAYGLVSMQTVVLFIQKEKLPRNIEKKLIEDNITILPYNDFLTYLSQLPEGTKVRLDSSRTSQVVYDLIPDNCKIVKRTSAPYLLKTVKNEAELAHVREAMKRDGAAMVEFLYWLENELECTRLTEYDIALKLIKIRSKQKLFRGISFYPIVGYQGNGAIVHFHVTEDTAQEVKKDGFLLVDSGSHYDDGTTDITRTIALSELSDQQKTDFTLVLKGMINVSMAQFPMNTKGCQLDILARKALLDHGLNYGHGTGHGVGYFLNVHEGPVNIRPDLINVNIEPGMIISNEPGIYRQGQYGIRIENLIACKKGGSNEYGNFLCFETLTLCPIDINAVKKNLLAPSEIDWLNNYHQRVFNELSPLLDEEHQIFLAKLTQAL